MRCKLDFTENPRWLEKYQPHLKEGLDFVDSPVYRALHRIHRCKNETIRWYYCVRDLDAANLRPALEQGCGKQTLSTRKRLFPERIAVCSECQNVKETEIQVCALFGYLRRENAAA